jgi:hypothetical protein
MYALHEALAREHMRQLLREAEREQLAHRVSRAGARRHLARHSRAAVASRRAHTARATVQ